MALGAFFESYGIEVAVAATAGLTIALRSRLKQQWDHLVERGNEKQRQLRQENEAVASWLLDYYERRGAKDDLYELQTAGAPNRLPFLSLPAWRGDRSPALPTSWRLPLAKAPTELHQPTLKRLSRNIPMTNDEGEEWNSPIITLRHVTASEVHIGWSEYFQYLSTCGRMELEARAAALRGATSPVRDANLPNATVAASGQLTSQAIGVCSAITYDTDEGTSILIQRRRPNVATYPGTYAVVPMFGCQPLQVDPTIGFDPRHDFLRELGEELFSFPELQYSTPHLRPDWFYEQEPIQDWIELEASGGVTLTTLGFGFDALNGELDIAMLCHFEDEQYFSRYRSTMKANWEAHNIGVLDLGSAELSEIIASPGCHPGSAFTIDLARQHLAGR